MTKNNKDLLKAIRRIVKEEIKKGKAVKIFPGDLMMKELPNLSNYLNK